MKHALQHPPAGGGKPKRGSKRHTHWPVVVSHSARSQGGRHMPGLGAMESLSSPESDTRTRYTHADSSPEEQREQLSKLLSMYKQVWRPSFQICSLKRTFGLEETGMVKGLLYKYIVQDRF